MSRQHSAPPPEGVSARGELDSRMEERPVVIVSDDTGITAETLSHSLLAQFPGIRFRTEVLPFVDSHDRAIEAVTQINELARGHGVKPLVFTTLVQEELRRLVGKAHGVFIDLFDAFLAPLEKELGRESSHSLGQSHGMANVARYTSRIGAVNYSVHTDDGLHPEDYGQAELILVGVSRSGKTPTCLYLALHFGIFAANYPLTMDHLDTGRLPDALRAHQQKLFGLTIGAIRLQQIRHEHRSQGRYSQLSQCRYEVRQAEALFRHERIPCADSTSMSIEEISASILQRMRLRRDLY